MRIKFVISLLISGIFIYWAFQKIDYPLMIESFRQANYLFLLPGIIFMFASHWLRAVRWRYFMEPIKRVDTPTLFAATMIGYYGNNVFPLRAGEVLRAYSIGKAAGVSRMSSFATIFVERLIDTFSLLLLLAFSIAFHQTPGAKEKEGWMILETGAWGVFAVTVLGTIFMIFLMQRTEQTLRLLDRMSRPFPQRVRELVQKLLVSFLEGFGIFKRSEHFFNIAWQSVVIWVFYAFTVYFALEAFNFNEKYDLPAGAMFVVLVMVSLGIMLPSAPSGIGPFHWACMKALGLFNVSESESLSFAVILHISNFIPVTLVGFYYYYKQQVNFREAMTSAEGDGGNSSPAIDASSSSHSFKRSTTSRPASHSQSQNDA